ncbi:hypothetical protein WK60_14060 [Burkholderia ubonensis]|nr:hypothetical protein WK60_14060 [Burkholderia ubonensis]
MNGPPLPAAGAHVWRWFLDLHRGRQCGFSPNPIAYHDMHSYFSLRRERPEPWEIKVLRRLDDVALNAMATKPST